MRIVFLGSGEFGLPTLRRLCQAHDVTAVISQPDRPAGRHRHLTPTPIARWAEQAGLSVVKCADINSPESLEAIARHRPEAAVVIAFGQKIGEPVLAVMGRLSINLHASLLPKYRGAAPINWAIIRGERETGLSVIGLAQRMDAGLIYGQARTPIDPQETAGELHDRLASMGPDLVVRVLAEFAAGTLRGQPQDDQHATRAPKLNKSDGHIPLDLTPEEFRCRVHGLTPWPGVRFRWHRAHGGVHELAIHRVACDQAPSAGDAPLGTIVEGHRLVVRGGTVTLLQVQAPGTRVMAAAEFARGHHLATGDRLESLTED